MYRKIHLSAPPRRVKLYAEGGEDEEIVSATLNLELCRWWLTQSSWREARKADLILVELEKLKEDKASKQSS